MDLTTAYSEAQKQSRESGTTLSVYRDQQGRIGYLRTNEVPSNYTILNTYTPDGGVIAPEKKPLWKRILQL